MPSLNRSTLAWIAGAVTLTVLGASRVAAIEQRALPAFNLVTLEGATVSSATLARPGKWLIIYGQMGCNSCDAVLKSIDAKLDSQIPERLVVVVGGADAAGAAKVASSYPVLAGAQWYADPTHAMGAAIKLPGAPVTFGLRRNMLEWSIAGAVPDVRSLHEALVSWVKVVEQK